MSATSHDRGCVHVAPSPFLEIVLTPHGQGSLGKPQEAWDPLEPETESIFWNSCKCS